MRNFCEMDAALSLIIASSADNDIENFMLTNFKLRVFGKSCHQCPDFRSNCGKLPDSRELENLKSVLADELQEYQDIFRLLING